MNSIFKKRKTQLELQKDIDENLKKQSEICPQEVLKLIFNERTLNREEMGAFDFLSPVVTCNRILKHLEELDKLYNKMTKFKCPK